MLAIHCLSHSSTSAKILSYEDYHFSTYGLKSNSYANVVRGCVCKNQYESAIYTVSTRCSRGLDREKLTASGLSFASSCSKTYPFVRGISITPSTMTCATWTPFGPNSRARDCERALRPNFALAKTLKSAEPRTLAVAPAYRQ